MTAKNANNPEENFKKLEKEINVMMEETINLKMAGINFTTQLNTWMPWRRPKR